MSKGKADKNAAKERAIASKMARSLRKQFEEGLELMFLARRKGEESEDTKEFVRMHPRARESREMARRVLKQAFEELKGERSGK